MNKRQAKANNKSLRRERKRIAAKERSVSAKSAYATYLESEHWRNFKKRKEAIDPKKCGACGDVKLVQLHHMIYRHPIENALLDDTCWLCRSCHEIFHQRAGTVLKKVKERNLLSETMRIIRGPRKTEQSKPQESPKVEVLTPNQKASIVANRTAKTEARHSRALAAMAKAKNAVVFVPKASGVGVPQPASYYLGMKVSYADQEKRKTKNGGWNKEQLKDWGVEWPPLAGWRDKLHQGKNPNI
jgi:hypothetical protein